MENRRALVVWGQVGRRFVLEHGLAGTVLDALTRAQADDDRLDLIERLSVIYDVLVPPATKDGG